MSTKENIVSPEIFKFHKINLDDILKELTTLTGLKIELLGTFPQNPSNQALMKLHYTSYISGTTKSLTKISSSLC